MSMGEVDLAAAENDLKGLKRALKTVNIEELSIATNHDGQGILYEVTSRGDLDVLEALLDAGVTPNVIKNHLNGMELVNLMHAVQRHSESQTLRCVHKLIKAGVKIEACNKGGEYAITLAAHYKCPHILSALISAGADVNVKNRSCSTPLMSVLDKKAGEAVWTLSLEDKLAGQNEYTHDRITECLTLLIKAGALTDEINASGLSALMKAAMQGHLEAVELLINHGANMELEGKGRTALTLAASHFRQTHTVMRYLLGRGARVDIQAKHGPSESALIALVQAVKYKPWEDEDERFFLEFAEELTHDDEQLFLELAEGILQKGGRVNVKNALEETLLHVAMSGPSVKGIEMLMRAGVKWDPLDGKKGCLWQIALNTTHSLEKISLLLDAGLDINFKNKKGNSILMEAVRSDHWDVMSELLRRGADPLATPEGVGSILMYAYQCGDVPQDALMKMIEAGVDLSLKNKRGLTAKDIALIQGHRKNLSLLEALECQQQLDLALINEGGSKGVLPTRNRLML